MPDPVNLRAARKARDRAEKRMTASQNAARFGRSKAQKALDQAQAEKSARNLDGHARDTGAVAVPMARDTAAPTDPAGADGSPADPAGVRPPQP